MSRNKLVIIALMVGMGALVGTAYADNVTMSRHNMSRNAQKMNGNPLALSNAWEDFGEVCVYCHTPHGANTNVQAPLWNRAVNTSGSYTPYSSSTIDTGVGQPGGVSLACLSCHDGTIAIDNIINAPGSGNYFPGGKNPVPSGSHRALTESCDSCHANRPTGNSKAALTTDLRSTHPISMVYPALLSTGSGADPKFNAPNLVTGMNGKFSNGVKLYNAKVECPSCHNPHLGEADYATDPGLKPFLRTSNEGSALCTTCHIK